MAKFLLLIYKILSITLLPLVIIIIIFRILQNKEINKRIKERFAFPTVKKEGKKLIWINASSIGEFLATISLIKKIRRLKPGIKILLTTSTKTSALLAEKITNKNIFHQFTPQDNPIIIRKFLNYWKPSLVLWMESEFWPIILDETKKYGVEIILINGRISDKSFKNWNSFKFLFKKIISNFSLILTMSKIDQINFKKLGAKNVNFIGNLKFCNETQNNNEKLKRKIEKIIRKRPVWLAASTHSGEEITVAKIHLKLKKDLKLKNLLTVIVPRNIKRSKKIKKEIQQYVSSVNFFQSESNLKNSEIIIDNSIGQLEIWYKKIKTVFLGKSYPPTGGQNPIEPAKEGCAIVSGEMSNFKEIQYEMIKYKSLFIAKNFLQFYSFIEDSLNKKKYIKKMQTNAKNYVKSKSKILDNTISKIKKYLV